MAVHWNTAEEILISKKQVTRSGIIPVYGLPYGKNRMMDHGKITTNLTRGKNYTFDRMEYKYV